nr:hypothetical protein [Tanacetum cinerariifolium]
MDGSTAVVERGLPLSSASLCSTQKLAEADGSSNVRLSTTQPYVVGGLHELSSSCDSQNTQLLPTLRVSQSHGGFTLLFSCGFVAQDSYNCIHLSSDTSISLLPPFMVRGVVDWCVTVSRLVVKGYSCKLAVLSDVVDYFVATVDAKEKGEAAMAANLTISPAKMR